MRLASLIAGSLLAITGCTNSSSSEPEPTVRASTSMNRGPLSIDVVVTDCLYSDGIVPAGVGIVDKGDECHITIDTTRYNILAVEPVSNISRDEYAPGGRLFVITSPQPTTFRLLDVWTAGIPFYNIPPEGEMQPPDMHDRDIIS